jgi:hypothetical protein
MRCIMGGTYSMHGGSEKFNKILVGKPERKRPQGKDWNNFFRFCLSIILSLRQVIVKAVTNVDFHKRRKVPEQLIEYKCFRKKTTSLWVRDVLPCQSTNGHSALFSEAVAWTPRCPDRVMLHYVARETLTSDFTFSCFTPQQITTRSYSLYSGKQKKHLSPSRDPEY